MADEATSKGSIMGLIIGTVVAAGAGFGFATVFLKQPERLPAAEAAASAPKMPKQPDSEIRALTPILTNLSNPSGVYVRLEAAIVLNPGTADATGIAAKISDDFLAYVRTVSLAEIQGPTGFQFFREDLKKHAIKLGKDKVQDVIIINFVIE